MNAWTTPTNTSKNRNTSIPVNGIKNATTIKSTSPANMFPNKRNVKLISRATSLIPSISPTTNPVGPSLKLMNLPRCVSGPNVLSPHQ